MTYDDEIPSPSDPGPLTSEGTQRHGLTTRARRQVSRVHALIASDRLAARLAASAAIVGALALVVWWAAAMLAAL